MNLNIVFLIALLMAGYGYYFEHNRYINTKIQFETFKATSDANAKKQEKDNADNIKLALGMRNDAINKLRDYQLRINSLQRTITAKTTSRICYDANGLDSAYRELVSEIRAISGEGQAGLIDNKSWLQAWPKN